MESMDDSSLGIVRIAGCSRLREIGLSPSVRVLLSQLRFSNHGDGLGAPQECVPVHLKLEPRLQGGDSQLEFTQHNAAR
jgi:hypothetical protein